MHITILSRNPNLYTTRRLMEAAQARGHAADVIDFLKCYVVIQKGHPILDYDGRQLSGIDAVIPRIGASRTFYGAAIVRQFELMDVFCLNGSQAIERSRNKLRALQILSRKGINLPMTAIAARPGSIRHLIKEVGGPPVVIKLLEGTQGIGVVLAETRNAAKSVMEAFFDLKTHMLIQEFVEEAKGSDIRALVIGNRVVAAMKRQGAEGEFRSNLHQGGSAIKIKLNKKERETAVKAAKALGLHIAGVDMLQSNRGPLVLEVNSSPGLEGLETTTGVDVADKIIAYIEKHHQSSAGKTDRIKV